MADPVIALTGFTGRMAEAEEASLLQSLGKLPYKLVCESYEGNNWDLFVMNADGSGRKNLTQTADLQELYPQVSPDGKRVVFICDEGEGRKTVRSVCVMDMNGKNRKTVAPYARQPFWHPDSKTIAYLPQEFKKFNIVDYFTKGLVFYNLETGTSRPHPNTKKLHHLYNPDFSPNGKWITATVHAGMGHGHANLLIEAEGNRIINLGIGGCRPCISPDGQFIAWGLNDHTIRVAALDTTSDNPGIGKNRFDVVDARNKIYHADWAPDGKHLSISRGIPSKGDISKSGTHEAACEIVGVYAKGWDIVVVPLGDHGSRLDLLKDPDGFSNITQTGASYKESDWFVPSR